MRNFFYPAAHLILNCVIDSEDRWWIGVHSDESRAAQWSGGYYTNQIPAHKISRAWLKLDEAIARFEIHFHPGDRVCELGAAPGGACQRLLEADLEVVGVDPAAIDPQISRHPRFTHWKKRARDLKMKSFYGFDWILTDMNIDPASTMTALGAHSCITRHCGHGGSLRHSNFLMYPVLKKLASGVPRSPHGGIRPRFSSFQQVVRKSVSWRRKLVITKVHKMIQRSGGVITFPDR